MRRLPATWSAVALAVASLSGLMSVACRGEGFDPQDELVARFGTTVVMPSGLHGAIYYIPPGSPKLPKVEKLKPVGDIYTNALNVPPTNFTQGFPGVTNRIEWFAIEYTGRFWIQTPGEYRFALTSDDGSKLYIDRRLAIDNDGIHPARTRDTKLKLSGGIHQIRVSYFQGPGGAIALILSVSPPGEDWRPFSTDEFRPPSNPADWSYPGLEDLGQQPQPSSRLPAGRAKN
jgi:hypothetical protein